MTAPRQILPGTCYFVTRRCSQREFLLRPSKVTNAVFLFLLAVAARRYGVQVHAFCVMSNHLHMVVTDTRAMLPAFHQFLDALLARAVNCSIGRWETFWAPNSYSAVKLASRQAIIDKTAYVLANPVSAGLVRSGRMWPGARSDPDRFGELLEVERPRHFFAEDSSLPRSATLELTPAPGFASALEYRDAVWKELRQQEDEARRRIGDRFLGVARVLKTNPRSRPASVESRRRLRPRVAARDRLKRVEAIAEMVAFVRAYRRAWAARRAGRTGVVFPAGTYLLRVQHGVRCAEFV